MDDMIKGLRDGLVSAKFSNRVADRIEALERENARLREALVMIATDTRFAQEFYDRNGPTWTSPQGNEYEDTSAYLAKMDELGAIAKAGIE